MSGHRSSLIVFTCLLGAIAMSSPAEARRVWPVVGVHPGDVTLAAECRHGEILRGLTGRAGLWVDQVALLCNAPNAADGDPTQQSDRYGGVGGAPFTAECSNTERLTAVKIDLTSDKKRIRNMILYCFAGDQMTRHEVASGATDSSAFDKCKRMRFNVGDILQGTSTACNWQSDVERDMPQQSCPNEDFVGVTVRFGADVNSIGFVCDTVAAN